MHAASAPLLIPSLSAGSYDRHLSSLFPFPLSLSDPSGDHSRFLSCPSFRPADFLHNIRFAGQSRKHLWELPEMAIRTAPQTARCKGLTVASEAAPVGRGGLAIP
jgi:hypothetical protein